MVKRILQLIGIVFGGMLGSQLYNWFGMGSNLIAYDSFSSKYGYYTYVAIGALGGYMLLKAIGC